ncbi:mechanosensitive ion channel [Paracoccus sp. S-4012]|uniref:mechanosensitive ion channel family protein n=1 Tax=Paracoccus sp. S-4012 TaxID=2665648 RepID=UPI0012AFF6DD|nr:mechanosensitive ion channel domain-containing protein [Paracoccus sp. S-4012]MRX49308.1 mechanosensitive ion channel [Paracoccus sp. S-4012]
MDNLTPELVEAARGVWTQLYSFLRIMTLPYRLWQLAAILGLMAIAHLARNWLAPRLNLWLRQRQNWPKWRLRFGILVQRKLRVILFAALSWAVVLVMRELTWPSRSQLIALAAALSAAWVAIEFAVRIIANRTFRRWVWWGLWIWVTLHFFDLTTSVGRVLDSIALAIGDYRLSVLGVLKAVALTALLIVVGRILSRLIAGSMARNADLTPTMRVLLAKLLQIVLLVVAVVTGLRALGLDLTGLTVFSGAIGLGIGFGLQKVVSNLISGVIILLDESIKPGDVISLGETFGWIDALGARYVSVVTRDGKEYLIPNEDLVTGQVVNWSHTNDFVRLDLEFRCSYADDPHEVSKTAVNASMTVKRVLAHRTPVCWVTEFSDFSVRYVLRFWISDPESGLTNVRGEVYLALWDAFKKKGITIPLPQREIRIVTDPPDPPPEINDPDADAKPSTAMT